MAQIDVSDLMFDPDLVDDFIVIRATQVVDADGRAQASQPTETQAFGSVQPASGRTLMQRPELANLSGVIEIYTVFGLQAQSDTTAADNITWQGKNYMVSHVDDVTNFSGFVHAICTLTDLSAAPTSL